MNYDLDHICLAVVSIDKAADRICKCLGYRVKTEKVINTRQDIYVQFFTKEGSIDFKLIMPASRQSPVVSFLKKHGEGLHHVGFKTDNVCDAFDEIVSKGAISTLPPEPGEAFCNELIAFSYLGNGLSVELVDTDKRVFVKKDL
ncbi:hypothetical protein MNBD_GAMMA09-3323 [hydrothermal vent metagenome]|uniref:VOC domain-containing protein n=1 Tax=hydrothermal vent metagenome TaxID=652676 RepID=A0A3B0YB05_9ZZZZ